MTGTSVLGLAFKDGVVIAADKLGSYGSMARFRNISRILKVKQFRNSLHVMNALFLSFNVT